jgi:hypothetical protein
MLVNVLDCIHVSDIYIYMLYDYWNIDEYYIPYMTLYAEVINYLKLKPTYEGT